MRSERVISSMPLSLSVDEYLAGERLGDVRHEYCDGQLRAMAGASDIHNLIAGNIFAALHARLRGSSCRVFMSDMKVRLRILERDLFYYPDVLVAGDPSDNHPYYREKPKLIVEVLSED